jgi:hypothetical protein
MTRSTRQPGRLLLAIARAVVDEPTLATVIEPALADFQQELREAGDSRRRRLRARWHGYRALAVLLVIAPLVFARAPVSGHRVISLPERISGTGLALLLLVLAASTWPVFGGFTVAAVAAGGCLAFAMRTWYNQHPGAPDRLDAPARTRTPEINLSSIPVGGDVAGLIFAVGSVSIVMLGLPQLRWFFLAAVAGGLLIAGVLAVWHTGHPASSTPRNSIASR